MPDEELESGCGLMYLTLQAMRSYKGEDFLSLGRYATQLYNSGKRHEMPQWVATGSFLLAMSLPDSRDAKRQAELLKQGLNELRRIGWRSCPMANDFITSFVVAKGIRFGLDGEMIDILLSTGVEMDLTPAFDVELRDPEITEAESIRLWKAALRYKDRHSTPTENSSNIARFRRFVSKCSAVFLPARRGD